MCCEFYSNLHIFWFLFGLVFVDTKFHRSPNSILFPRKFMAWEKYNSVCMEMYLRMKSSGSTKLNAYYFYVSSYHRKVESEIWRATLQRGAYILEFHDITFSFQSLILKGCTVMAISLWFAQYSANYSRDTFNLTSNFFWNAEKKIF